MPGCLKYFPDNCGRELLQGLNYYYLMISKSTKLLTKTYARFIRFIQTN